MSLVLKSNQSYNSFDSYLLTPPSSPPPSYKNLSKTPIPFELSPFSKPKENNPANFCSAPDFDATATLVDEYLFGHELSLFSSAPPSPPLAAKEPRELRQLHKEHGEKLAGRMVFSDLTLAPTTIALEEEKASGVVPDKDVMHHASMRQQLFAIAAVALHGLAKRSSGEVRDIIIEIGRAYMQIGQGSDGFHAAHQHTTAGMRDNFRSSLISSIHQEETVTPRTEKFLRNKGFTDAQIALLKEACSDIKAVFGCFNEAWPENKKIPESIFAGTEVEILLNATSELPARVNLGCDKSLEQSVRGEALKLYEALIKEEMTPQEACEKYNALVIDHFTSLEPALEQRVKFLNDYKALFEQLNPSNAPTDRKIVQIAKKLDFILAKIKEKPHQNLSRARMRVNKDFLRKAKNLSADDMARLVQVKKYLVKVWGDLTLEIENQCSRFSDSLKYLRLELKGSELPDFVLLFGVYTPIKGRQLKPDSLANVQAQLLKPKAARKLYF